MDLVAAAGVDTSDWANFKGSRNKIAANPKYCYEWAFVEPKRVAVFNIWHDLMKENGEIVSVSFNIRQFASERVGIERTRALRMDDAIKAVINERLPIRVIVLGGKRRNIHNPGEKASRVSKRLLDPVNWTITEYNWKTGQCTFVRGIYELSISKSKSENAIDDLDDVPEGNSFPDRAKGIINTIKRDYKVRKYVLERAQGRCEHCGALGFSTPKGGHYIETHHIIFLAESGPDTVKNVIALCPQHHREAHYGIEGEDLEKKFIAVLKKLNSY